MLSNVRAAARRVLPSLRVSAADPFLATTLAAALVLGACLPRASAQQPPPPSAAPPVATAVGQDTGRTARLDTTRAAASHAPKKTAEAAPTPTPQTHPAEARPTEPKRTESRPVETRTTAPKVTEPKPTATKPNEAKEPKEAVREGPPPPALPAAEVERLRRDALLPGHRIVAFYGTPLSKGMGILGELPPSEMLAKLQATAAEWRKADPSTPVTPALQLIVSTAAGSPGPEGKYRTRAPESVIREVIDWADSIHALVFLDIQPGHSTVQEELPRLLPYLLRPNVNLALDPEWNMPPGVRPAAKIGTMDASTVNYAVDVLAKLVQTHNLPPKILIVHRFTRHMVTNVEKVQQNDPRVQVVLDMDGWGPPTLKRSSYLAYVAHAPIDLKGFKLFFKNDRKGDSHMMTPAEVLALKPAPIYIQYQ